MFNEDKYPAKPIFLLFFKPTGPFCHSSTISVRDINKRHGNGGRITAINIAHLPKVTGLSDIQLRLIADESYNAFVRGGQTIYLHTGLLTKAGSTSEILGVLAHEIGHLAAGHAPRRSEAIQDAGLTTTLATLAAAALAVGGSGDAAIGVAFGGADRANRNYFGSLSS